MRNVLSWIALITLLIAGGGIWWLQARPVPSPTPSPIPAPAPADDTNPKITWSVARLTTTMFPGTSSAITVSFRSSRDLTNVAIEITPSLNGIAAASPSTFASVVANQDYQITLTLTAPPEFVKRGFGGTIQVRDAGRLGNTYAATLEATLNTDWSSYTNTVLNVTFSYPLTNQVTTREVKRGTEIVVIDPAAVSPDLTVLMALQVFAVTSSNPSILDVIKQRLNPAGIISVSPLDSGMLVEADTLQHWHFFLYSTLTNRGLEVYGPPYEYFTSKNFASLVSSLHF